jgi:hypothetical protein
MGYQAALRLFLKGSLGLLTIASLASCSFKNIVGGDKQNLRQGSEAIDIIIPAPAGMGLLDGSGNMAMANDPIVQMTSCSDASESIMPARTIRLTMKQLYETLKFHSKVALQESEFVELSKSTTSFKENSYSLLGDDSFIQLAHVQAKKAAATMNLALAINCDVNSLATNQDCMQGFVNDFASRVLRFPLTNSPEGATLLELLKTLVSSQSAEAGLRLTIQTIFQHPLFLYRQELGRGPGGVLDGYELATMISYSLTDLPPDDLLWQDTKDNKLSVSTMTTHLQRILADNQKIGAFRDKFFAGYLGLNDSSSLEKAFINEAEAKSSQDSFRSLIQTTPMSKIFQIPSDSEDGRIGLHTHRYFLMNHSRAADHVSEIHIGIAIRKKLFCQNISAPPVANLPTQEGQTAIQARKAANACYSCHQYIDPVGQNYLSFSGNGSAIADAETTPSEITATIDLDDTYQTIEDLSLAINDSEHIKRCMSLQVYRLVMSRPEQLGEQCHINQIYEKLNQGETKLEDLILTTFTYSGTAKRR